MPSLFESVTSLLGKGDSLSKVASVIGGDTKQAQTAVDVTTPAILGGLANQAERPGGADAIMGMLDRDDGSAMNDVGGFLESGNVTAGNEMLDSIFGDERVGLVSSLASQSGLNAGMIGKLSADAAATT